MAAPTIPFLEPIERLRDEIAELESVAGSDRSAAARLKQARRELSTAIDEVFSDLTAWQRTQIARHPDRPYVLEYIHAIFTDFLEMHGDRRFADDPAVVAGFAEFDGEPVAVVGHQKGRDTAEKLRRNFGMPRPEGYRKALRLMQMAERFGLPIYTFVDTPGAYPGVGAEERGQSEAIARNLQVMAGLRAPIITTVTGEGGSGGALAIGVGDRLIMLQYSTYSVISPEGCASILWKSAEKAQLAAEAMAITSDKLYELGLVDAVVPEPLGGAHRDVDGMAATLKATLLESFAQLEAMPMEQLLDERYARLRDYGRFKA